MADKILIVDDDEEFRSEFKDAFEEFGVRDARNGMEALEILRKPNEIDLVILDLKMPGLSGLDVLKEAKRIDKDLSVIIFTGYGSKETVIEAFRQKVDDFIEKPINVEKTRSTIEKVLDRKHLGDESVQESKGISGKLEKVKHYIRRNIGRKVNLQYAAGLVFMSPKYFSRVFKQKTGDGFKDFVLKVMIDKAKELLTRTEYSVEEISFKMGYKNSESFIRIFQKFTGCTPSEFRKKNTRKKSAYRRASGYASARA